MAFNDELKKKIKDLGASVEDLDARNKDWRRKKKRKQGVPPKSKRNWRQKSRCSRRNSNNYVA